MAKVTRKEALRVVAWERFMEQERGFFPPSIAAACLKMTPQGVRAASDRGWIRFFQIGTERFYSRRDVLKYVHNPSRRGSPSRPVPPFVGRQNLEDDLP